jgi:ribose transport system ATP-binding protein
VTDVAVSIRGLDKSFGSQRALDDVSLEVPAGSVHGLAGANGSGKSTLVKVLSGYHEPDRYEACAVWGQDVALPLKDAATHGIVVVQQDMALAEDLTVLENVAISGGLHPPAGRGMPLRRGVERKELRRVLRELGWTNVAPDARIRDLTAAQRAIVAIVRAVTLGLRSGTTRVLLILDEPTAYLSDKDSRELFGLLDRMISAGNSAILVSHRLNDIVEHCDHATVLRDARVVGRLTGKLEKAEIEDLMIGELAGRESLQARTRARKSAATRPRLTLKDFSCETARDVEVAIDPGEILGCTGLAGSGFEELPYGIAGVSWHTGTVSLDGASVAPGSIENAHAAGIGIVPDDRSARALWPVGSVAENLFMMEAPHGRLRYVRPMLKRRDRAVARRTMVDYGVTTREPDASVNSLSGGNQQKVVLGRVLARRDLRLVILHEPTSGVDVGARTGIYNILRRRVQESGLAVLLCSSDLEEVALLSDRVIVFAGGRVVARIDESDIAEDRLSRAMQL